ncbi:hypothetical protein B0H11DRAFT_2236827 [Mycena galericulata]|nr:hypothetical protein B0H11DRAFT_2236827 [Mycena galericulata]
MSSSSSSTSPPTSNLVLPTPSLDMSGSSFRFPPELEREIFETAALLYPEIIPTLLRVARHVLLWKVETQDIRSKFDIRSKLNTYTFHRIEPLLYNVIDISIFESLSGSGREMLRRLEAKGADYFSTAVRHLTIFVFEWGIMGTRSKNVWSKEELERVFCTCTRVQELIILGELAQWNLLSMLADSRPTRLVLVIDVQHPSLNFTQPLFQKLTHLAVGDITSSIQADWKHWLAIFRLPALTHLALAQAALPTASLVREILADAPQLKILAIFAKDLPAATIFSEQLAVQDERLVILGHDHFSDPNSGLKRFFRIASELWIQADEFVDRKRRGEIQAVQYYMPKPHSFSTPGAEVPLSEAAAQPGYADPGEISGEDIATSQSYSPALDAGVVITKPEVAHP